MMEAYGLTDPGCVRPNNEDYYLLVPKLDLYLVADGMGGAQAGEHASKLAVETVARRLNTSAEADAETLLQAVEEANRCVLDAAGQDSRLHGMGTTLTVCWKSHDDLLFANVGDSRAYVFQDNQLLVITEDQTWVNEVGRKLGIGDDALRTHPMRHVLTMAIGVSDSLRVQTYAVRLKPGAQFLLCSDGLHGVVATTKIAEVLAGNGSLENKCRGLVEAAKEAGGPDNVTAVILRNANSIH
jgi:PPM family protein phosphatase